MDQPSRRHTLLLFLLAVAVAVSGWAIARHGSTRRATSDELAAASNRGGGEESRGAPADSAAGAGATAPRVPAPIALVGEVVDWRGRGLVGVAVSTLDSDSRATTDDAGRFTLEDSAGVAVRLARDGFAVVSGTLEPGPTNRFVLLPLPVLAGRVLTTGAASGRTAHLSVRVRDRLSGQEITYETDAGGDGAYRFAALPEGELVALVCTSAGFAPIELAPARALEPGETTYLDVELVPGAEVRGTLVDASTEEPIADAHIWATAADRARTATRAVTSDAGEFALGGVAYESGADGLGWAEFALHVRAPGQLEDSVQLLRAPYDAGQAYRFVVAVTVLGDLQARVTDTEGRAVAQVQVVACGSNGSLVRGFTDGDGRVRLRGIPAGLTWLAAWALAPEGGEGIAWFQGELAWLDDAAPLELELSALRVSTIEGRISDAEGGLPPELVVEASATVSFAGTTAPLGVRRSGHVDAEGRYRVHDVLPGRTVVRVGRLVGPSAAGEESRGFAPLSSSGDAARIVPPVREVSVEPGESVRGVDFAWLTPFTVSGRADPGGRPTHLIVAELRDATGVVVAETRLRGDGGFELGPLAPQSYRLVVRLGARELVDRPVGPASVEGLLVFLP